MTRATLFELIFEKTQSTYLTDSDLQDKFAKYFEKFVLPWHEDFVYWEFEGFRVLYLYNTVIDKFCYVNQKAL
jgi:hypothetical protein